MFENIDRTIGALKSGQFILLYDFDGREHETDLVVASQYISHTKIRTLRKDGGGLICTTIPSTFWQKISMPFLVDLFERLEHIYPVLGVLKANDIPYDSKSSFGLTINHRKTFTGITDIDRALTINEIAKVVEIAEKDVNSKIIMEKMKEFRTPGHVHLLNASPGLVKERKGHTEMSTYLMKAANLVPSATICEMMGDDGYAMKKEHTMKYADEHNIPFITGDELIAYAEAHK